MDAGDKGFVNVAGTVGGQLLGSLGNYTDGWGKEKSETDEEDAIKVFELAEEDGDEGVALYIVYVPFLEEYVGFIKEEYGFPGDGILEDFL